MAALTIVKDTAIASGQTVTFPDTAFTPSAAFCPQRKFQKASISS